jgi:hypothetical protein
MEQSPLKVSSYSASQEFLRLLWNQKVHYRVHNSPPPVPVLCQMHSVHTLPRYFPKIHSNIIHTTTPNLSFRFSNEKIV